ncbi:MAG: hypothetical protein ABRQ24_03775 [Syntrophomonadaceae bacterium]
MAVQMRRFEIEDKDDILARSIIQENTGGRDPELSLAHDFLDELDMRLEQIKIYYPIMETFRKRKPDELAQLVPEVCLLTLSYLIYEGKLKQKGLTFQDLVSFLSKTLPVILARNIADEAVRELTADILDGLQNGGRNFFFSTYSFKTSGFRERYVKLLDIKQLESGRLHYYITEQGVDFFLRTKEFPEETKVTINLLLFQKQMEKGAFGFAYETVRRLNLEVQRKKERKYALLEALTYGLLDQGEAYGSYHQSIVRQFEEEAELFNTAVMNVSSAFSEYVERINQGTASEREIRTFTLLKIIEKEISRAQTWHTQLLKEAAGFTQEYDRALGIRRKAIFTERFSFEAEFEKLITRNGQPPALKYLFEPLLNPRLSKSFNPLRILEPQRLTRPKPEENRAEAGEIDADRETMDVITGKRVRRNFLFYAARLLEALDTTAQQVELSEFCRGLISRYSEDSVYNGDFLSFIIEVNRDKQMGQHSRVIRLAEGSIQTHDNLKTIEDVFVKAAWALESRINRITVTSQPEQEIELLPGLKMTNILFTGERP